MSAFLELVEDRRSIYALGKNTEYTNEQIVERVREVMKDLPSANNTQTSRVVVLFGEENDKFWDHIYDVQKDVLEGDVWDMMSGIMVGAKEGVGTILFFEDLAAVDKMPAQGVRREAYKQNNNAIAQYALWLALRELDLGASLQHFNVGYEHGYDKGTKEMFNLPESYEMLAQMPFGSIEQEVGEKEYIDSNEQVKVFGN